MDPYCYWVEGNGIEYVSPSLPPGIESNLIRCDPNSSTKIQLFDPTQFDQKFCPTQENAHFYTANHLQTFKVGHGLMSDAANIPSSHLLQLDPYYDTPIDDFKVASISAASDIDGPGTALTSPIQGQKRNASMAGFDSSPATASVESPDHGDDAHGRNDRRRPVKRACNECRQQKVSNDKQPISLCFRARVLSAGHCRRRWKFVVSPVIPANYPSYDAMSSKIPSKNAQDANDFRSRARLRTILDA